MTTEPPNPPEGGPVEPPVTPQAPPDSGLAEPPVTPPPPPDSPVPAPVGGPAPFQVGEAFNYGWKKFQEYLGPILIIMVILFVVGLAVNGIGILLSGGFDEVFDMDSASSGQIPGLFFSFGYLFYSLVSALVGLLIQAAIVRGALGITKGEKIDVNTFLSTENIGQIVLAAILLAIGTAIGLVLCVIPGLIFAFFTQFTYYFIIDKRMEAIDGIKASFSLVNKNLGSVVGLFFASILALIVGAILCGIGLIVAIPVTIIATAYAYRKLSGQEVVA